MFGHGYYFDANNTNYNVYPASEINSINDNMPVFVFDDVLKQYRSDTRKREPQFLGFDIQDDNIEVKSRVCLEWNLISSL